MFGMNPREMQKAMKRLGMKQEDIDALQRLLNDKARRADGDACALAPVYAELYKVVRDQREKISRLQGR